jgi:L-amino acid N-acyltransferase
VIVRPAGRPDAGPVGDIWNAVIRETLITFNPVEKSCDEVAELISVRSGPVGGTFVAEEAGAVLGFVTYGQFRSGAGYARTMEHTIHLVPGARGRGLGRALMVALEGDARAKGVHSLIAGVSSASPEGRGFHAALGFHEVAVLPEVGWKCGRWLDLHLMQKRL